MKERTPQLSHPRKYRQINTKHKHPMTLNLTPQTDTQIIFTLQSKHPFPLSVSSS